MTPRSTSPIHQQNLPVAFCNSPYTLFLSSIVRILVSLVFVTGFGSFFSSSLHDHSSKEASSFNEATLPFPSMLDLLLSNGSYSLLMTMVGSWELSSAGRHGATSISPAMACVCVLINKTPFAGRSLVSFKMW